LDSKLAKLVDILKAFFKVGLGVLIFIGFQMLVILVMELLHISTRQYQGLYSILYASLTAISLYGLSVVESKKRDKLFKFKKPKIKAILLMIIIGFGILGLVTMYMAIARTLADMFENVGQEVDKYRESVDRFSNVDKETVPAWDSILYMFSITVMVPICEEFLFRGVIFGELKRVMKGWIAVILSAAVFGFLHGLSVQIGYAFLCGLVIAIVYYVTGNMIYTIFLHSIFNFFGSTLIYFLEWDKLGIAESVKNSILNKIVYFELVGLLALFFIALIAIVANHQGMFDEGKKSFDCDKKTEAVINE